MKKTAAVIHFRHDKACHQTGKFSYGKKLKYFPWPLQYHEARSDSRGNVCVVNDISESKITPRLCRCVDDGMSGICIFEVKIVIYKTVQEELNHIKS